MTSRPTWQQALVIAALACTPPLAAGRTGGDCDRGPVACPSALAGPAASDRPAATRQGAI